MNAEIIAVGTELLLGDILNTNAQYLSMQLAGLGISVFFQTVVGDNPDRICQAYDIAFGRSDIVITIGGLGPTKDDLTREMAARYFQKTLVLDAPSLENINALFKKQGFKMTKSNEKQAYIIEGSRALLNERGTAPGILYEQNDKTLIMLPGPPGETIPMFEKHVAPYLRTRTDEVYVSRTLRVVGVGESAAEEMLKELIDNQTNPTIAPYAKTFEVHFRLTASAKNEEEAKALIQPVADRIYAILGDSIYSEGDTPLEAAVGGMLIEKGLTIACAESCTGGMLTALLIDCPGISQSLIEGVVTYSNESKMKRLGVKPETLEAYGAVSPETAEEMARGVAETSGARIGVGITGVAGPDGGTEDKPVGLVYLALWMDGETFHKRLDISGDRKRVRSRSVSEALDLIRRRIM